MFDISLDIIDIRTDFISVDYPVIFLELQKYVPKYIIIPVKLTNSWTDLIKQNPAEDYIHTTSGVDYLNTIVENIVENISHSERDLFTINNTQTVLQQPKKINKNLGCCGMDLLP